MMLVAQGINPAGLAEMVIKLKTEKELSYEKEATSDGVMRNIGGANMTLYSAALSFEESVALLTQLGLSLAVPSREITIGFPDPYTREINIWYGVVTLNAETTDNGWLTNFRLEFTGLVVA
jgi:hypothetical protein